MIPENNERRNWLNRDQLLTVGDLLDFKKELLEEIKQLTKRSDASEKRWVRSRDVRKILGISNGTLQTLRINGELSYSRLGTLTYYDYEDVLKRLEKNAR
jgi:hypothetical protein